MKLAQSLKSTTVFVRRFGTAPPPVVPTAAELAQNDEIIANYRKLNHTSVTPKFMGHDMVPSAKYIQEPVSVGDIHALSGVPADQINRTCVIGPRKVKTLQSGSRFANQWTIQWKAEHERWSNPLMGWTSTSDPYSGMKLHFDSKESAVQYAKQQGWKFETLAGSADPADGINRYPMRTYADNFLPRKTMEKVVDEGGITSDEFKNYKFGESHWFPPLNYHGTAPARQHGDEVKQ